MLWSCQIYAKMQKVSAQQSLLLIFWIASCVFVSGLQKNKSNGEAYTYLPYYNSSNVVATTTDSVKHTTQSIWPTPLNKPARDPQSEVFTTSEESDDDDDDDDENKNIDCVPPEVIDENELPVEQKLMRKLLKSYERSVRPVKNAGDTVVVRMGITITQIFQMDEKNQVLITNVWLDQEWDDTFLTWDPQEYGGLEVLRLPCHKLWLPDIVLYNNAAEYTDGLMPANAMIHFTGNVFWPVPTKLQSSCKVDVTYFPFDEQKCIMKFGSWTYDGFQVDMVNRTLDVDLTNYVPNGEWELISIKIQRNVMYYACCPEPFPDVTFIIHIHRRIIYYLYNVIFPCIMMSALTLLVFCLPPDSGEKITLGITVLLAFSVFLLRMGESLPETSEYIPLLSIYLTVVMGLTSISVIMTVLVLNLHFRGPCDNPVPRWLKFLFVGTVGYKHQNPQKKVAKKTKAAAATQSMRFVDKYVDIGGNTGRDINYRYHRGSSLRNTLENLAQELDGEYKQQQQSYHTPAHTSNYSSPHGSYINDYGNLTHTFHNEAVSGGVSLDEATEETPISISNELRHTAYNSQVDFTAQYNYNSIPTPSSNTTTAKCVAYHGIRSNAEILSAMKNIIQRYEKEEGSDEVLYQWRQVAAGVDRILFFIFLTSTLTATLVILIVAPITRFI